MNDPHVVALLYRVRHDESADYGEAEPLDHDEPGFSLHIEAGRLRVSMKEHYPTEDAARKAVEPFLRAWELDAGLRRGSGEFELAFECSEITDRSAYEPGTVSITQSAVTTVRISTRVIRATYPAPPRRIARDANVDLMYDRYRRYCDGHTTISDAANFCLTALIESAGDRKAAAEKYKMAETILKRLGELAATKGGVDARKAKAAYSDYTAAERRWLEDAMKAMIRRAAEVAHDPAANQSQITMADLPDP